MKNKKGQNVWGVTVVSLLVVGILLMGFVTYTLLTKDTVAETIVQNEVQTEKLVQQSNAGDVAQIKVSVRDISANDVNTKVAVTVYCQSSSGEFIIDSTSSSATTEISGSTTRGDTVTCWAFNSTTQTKEPVVRKVDKEIEHIVIDTYQVSTSGHLQFYTDTYATGTGGTINVTGVVNTGTGTLAKLRYTNNNSNKWMPLGGFYFATVAGSNISKIDISGSASLSGVNHASTQIVQSTLGNQVSTRKDNWDYVFEIDDSSEAGNQPVILEDNDYLESGTVKVTGQGTGCTASASGGELVSPSSFSKGYYRSQKDQEVYFGSESDATSSSVISSDITGDTFYCTA
jgi:hypothetical protein